MQKATISKAFSFINSFDQHTIINGYYGSCNLVADHLNDYSTDATNEFIGEWLGNNLNQSWNNSDLTALDVISNPDYLIQTAANEFYNAFAHVFNAGKDCESEFKHAVYLLDECSNNYFVFGEQWSNACQTVYIVQEIDFNAAYEKLKEYYSDKYYPDGDEEESMMDNVQFIGEIVINE